MTGKSRFTAYVSCLKGRAIEVFTGDAIAGTLEHVQTVELLGKGLPLARSRDGRRLFASSFEETEHGEIDRIESFEIDPDTSELSRISSTEILARMAHISVDRSGGFLLGASFPSSQIAVFPIGDRGHVQCYPSDTMTTPFRSHQMLADYSNRFVYVPCMLSHTLVCLKFDERTGTIEENSPPAVYLPDGAGPRHVAFHPNRRYLYLLNEKNGTVVAYRLGAKSGSLTEIMTTPYCREEFVGEAWGAQIHVSPDGSKLFAADRKGSTLAVFDIDVLGGQIRNRCLVDVGQNPRCHDLTPNGKFLVLAALGDNKIEMYDISDPANAPNKVLDLPTSEAPAWVEIVS